MNLWMAGLLAACKPPQNSPSIPVGTLEDPVRLDPIDVVYGRYEKQNLGGWIQTGHYIDTDRESFLIGSTVNRQQDSTIGPYVPTPGDVVLLSEDRDHRMISGTRTGWGSLHELDADLDGDGLREVLIGTNASVDFYRSPLTAEQQPQWSRRRIDFHEDHPLRTPAHLMPGSALGLDAQVAAVSTNTRVVAANFTTDEVVPTDLLADTPMYLSHPARLGETDRFVAAVRFLEPLESKLVVLSDTWLNDPAGGWSLEFEDDFLSYYGLVSPETGAGVEILVHQDDRLYGLDPNDVGHPIDDSRLLLRAPVSLSTITSGDLDGDGLDDLIVGRINDDTEVLYVYRGPLCRDDPDREPDMLLAATYPDLPRIKGIATADLDGDGQDELAIAYALDTPGTVHIYEDALAEWHEANPGRR